MKEINNFEYNPNSERKNPMDIKEFQKYVRKNNFIKESAFLIKSETTSFIPERLSKIANSYALVFSGPPWNEAVKCDTDGQFKGLDTPLGSKCNDCGGTYVEAYPLEETIDYIKKESQKLGFKSREIIDYNDDTIGFAWSYLITPEKLVQSKWNDSKNQNKIIDLLNQQNINPNQNIRYFSECGIDPNFRGIGLSNLLSNIVSGPEITIYRTNCLSPMMAVANRIGFTQIMGPEVIIDRQAKNIFETGQVINFLDIENPQRTLFIKKF